MKGSPAFKEFGFKNGIEAAKALGVSRDTLYRWLSNPARRAGVEARLREVNNDPLDVVCREVEGLSVYLVSGPAGPPRSVLVPHSARLIEKIKAALPEGYEIKLK